MTKQTTEKQQKNKLNSMKQPSVVIVYDKSSTLLSLSFLSSQGFNNHFIKPEHLSLDFLQREKPQILLFDISEDTHKLIFQNSHLKDFLFKKQSYLSVIAITNKKDSNLWKEINVKETILRPYHYSSLLAKVHKHVYENFINRLQNLHKNEASKNKKKKFNQL